MKTLTLEDFLESERHKLTGTLTPVTPETFAKWKKERLDKRAAEAEAHKAKEATGKAMFESGDWKGSEDEDSESDEGDGDAEGEGEGQENNGEGWNLEAMRRETERLREEKEQERLVKLNGEGSTSTSFIADTITSSANDDAGRWGGMKEGDDGRGGGRDGFSSLDGSGGGGSSDSRNSDSEDGS